MGRLVWILLGVFALILGWGVRLAVFTWVAFVVFGLAALSALVGFLALRGVRAGRRISTDRVSLNGQLAVEVTVENEKRLPVLWLSARDTVPPGLLVVGKRGQVAGMRGRGRLQFGYRLVGLRRGYYRIGPVIVRSGDFFGLARREVRGDSLDFVTVYPRVVPLERVALAGVRSIGDVRLRRRAFEDPTRIAGVREYRHGDEFSRIHWKATARTGALKSKLYDVSSQLQITIVANLNEREYPGHRTAAAETAELVLVAAASLASYALGHRQRVGLLSNGGDARQREAYLAAQQIESARQKYGGRWEPDGQVVRLAADRDPEQLARILTLLGRLEFSAGPALSALLSKEQARLPWAELLLVITPSADLATIASLQRIRRAGFAVSVLVAGRSAEADRAYTALVGQDIESHRVREEIDLHAVGL